jgi:peptidoglycan-associated lipoprotein
LLSNNLILEFSMKKLIFSIVLVNLLVACGSIRTPFDSPAPKQDSAAAAPAPEAVKTDAATTADVNAKSLDKPAAETPVAAETPAVSDAAPKAEATATAEATPAPAVAETTPPAVANDPLNDPASALSKRSVHFPFDVDTVQEADKSTIKAHGAYLAAHSDKKVRVEGNTDERGSSEYNLALGQHRANNTKKALILSGAKSEQIESISYGEEKPLAAGHDEASWSQNRRADINYK